MNDAKEIEEKSDIDTAQSQLGRGVVFSEETIQRLFPLTEKPQLVSEEMLLSDLRC